jgi:hypothetical protein
MPLADLFQSIALFGIVPGIMLLLMAGAIKKLMGEVN